MKKSMEKRSLQEAQLALKLDRRERKVMPVVSHR
jgi:hypothetical protein